MTPHPAEPLPFPHMHPDGFEMLKSEPVFDPAKHLALEAPKTITTLGELGYATEDIAECPTDLGITSTFKVLSDEGAACMLDVARQLESFVTSNARISRNVRGGTYRSKFLRDLCMCPDLTDAISHLCKTKLLPHTIPHQMGHLNYNPLEVGENVDKWHVDTLRIDFVMFVTDPNSVEGGEFEFFKGTKHEVADLKAKGLPIPQDRIIQAELPGPGYAVLQQGNLVVHRAKALSAPGERITMVNGYVPADPTFKDFSRYDQLKQVDPDHVVATEYARHVSWMAREALNAHLNGMEFGEDRAKIAERLESVSELLTTATTQLRDASVPAVEHFGDE